LDAWRHIKFCSLWLGVIDLAPSRQLKTYMEKKERKPSGYWTYERCKEEAGKYKTKTEFNKGNGSAYNAAWENGWLNDFDFEEKEKPKGYWKNYEHCKEEAKKYKTKNQFKKGNESAYQATRINGWIDEFFPKAA
jgi:hypothetical protein